MALVDSDSVLATLLVEYARLLNEHGPDSPEVSEFEEQHKDTKEFTKLSSLARRLKEAALKGESELENELKRLREENSQDSQQA